MKSLFYCAFIKLKYARTSSRYTCTEKSTCVFSLLEVGNVIHRIGAHWFLAACVRLSHRVLSMRFKSNHKGIEWTRTHRHVLLIGYFYHWRVSDWNSVIKERSKFSITSVRDFIPAKRFAANKNILIYKYFRKNLRTRFSFRNGIYTLRECWVWLIYRIVKVHRCFMLCFVLFLFPMV